MKNDNPPMLAGLSFVMAGRSYDGLRIGEQIKKGLLLATPLITGEM